MFDLNDPSIQFFGIYGLENKITGGVYIGSTSRTFKKRFMQHRGVLRNNKHHSEHLQRSYNKYGESNFVFNILEVLDNKDVLLQVEQKYIDEASLLYNTCKTAGSVLNYKHTEVTKKKLSLIKLKPAVVFYHKKTEKWKCRMRVDSNILSLGSFFTYEEAINSKLNADNLFCSESFKNLTKDCKDRLINLEKRKRVLLNINPINTNTSGHKHISFRKDRELWCFKVDKVELATSKNLQDVVEERDKYISHQLNLIYIEKEEILNGW